MAEARQATHTPQVQYNEDGTSPNGHEKRIAKSAYKEIQDNAVRTWKHFENGLWPTTWNNLVLAFAACVLLMSINQPQFNYVSKYLWRFGEYYLLLDDSYPYVLRILVISFVSSISYFVVILYVRQYLLKILLAYKGWLYQPPKSQSVVVMVWGLLVRMVSNRRPTLYSYQNTLPRMSVPPLKGTVTKLLDSLKPLLDKEEYQKMELDAKEFLNTIGPKLQWVLHLKSWWSPNYHTDWWEKYVYLMSRHPLAINSNYALHDQIGWIPSKIQTARAAGVTSLILSFKSLLDSETLPPLLIRDTIPTCMWQYKKMFATARIPRTDGDILRHTSGSEHIVVYAKGRFYKVFVVDAHGKSLNALDLQPMFEWILKDAEAWEAKEESELRIAALTANNRDTWAQCRRAHFTSGINRESVHAIEEAIMLVVLDDNQFSDVGNRVKYLLHGAGASIWFDKSINAIFFTDGKMGLNLEHSWADAPVIAHLAEYYLTNEYLYRLYDEDGNCQPYISPDNNMYEIKRSQAVITPMRLYWEVNPELGKIIDDSYHFSVKNCEDLQYSFKRHDAFGKGYIKKTKNSPDAFIQMALQLAYYKDSGGKFALTYEASMTRLYLQGRTETVRSLTQEVQAFVLAMNDPDVSAKEKVRLMRVAAVKHQGIYRDCMSGLGIDRHLFALYVVCKGQGYDNPFLKNVLTTPWTLSTSQVPLLQSSKGVDPNDPSVQGAVSPGGGFGPVSDQGYGVSYVMINDIYTAFHITAKNSCAKTDANRFMENVFWAMSEMKRVNEEAASN